MLNIEKKTIKYKAIIISAFTLKNLKIKIGKNEIKKYIINVLFKLNFFNKMWCKWLLSAEKGSFLFGFHIVTGSAGDSPAAERRLGDLT